MIRISLEAEIRSFIERHKDMTLDDGRLAIVRNGYNPERAFTVSSGTVTVKVPRSRDRRAAPASPSAAPSFPGI